MIDNNFRAEIAALAAQHVAAMHGIRERKAIDFRRKSAREGIARVWLAGGVEKAN